MAGLRLGLNADVSSDVPLAIPVGVVPRVATLVRDNGGDGVGCISLDEEAVDGCGALRDSGCLMGGI